MKNSAFISKIGKKDLHEFIDLCKKIGIGIDEEKFESVVSNTMKYLNGDKGKRNELRCMQEIENRWYKSLENGSPDFSVYDDIYYLADAWVCWKKYSREYIKSIESEKSLATRLEDGTWGNLKSIKDYIGKVKRIADLGCGMGYTSASLKQLFNCDLYATNLEGTNQYKICEIIAKECGFNLLPDFNNIGYVDLVFASEYFEHFQAPLEHLSEVIDKLKPKYIIFANTFNAKSIGHFPEYKYGLFSCNGKSMSRFFTQELKIRKYRKVKTNCFNDRPNLYEYVG
jgi:SAM-dependent methyltransferase